MAGKKHKATVVVPKREGFNGVWAAGRHWAGDQQHEAELTDEEVSNLARRPGVVVIIGGKVARPVETTTSTVQVALTQDELAELEKFRAEQAKKETAPTQLFTLEKENRAEAIQRAGGETNRDVGSSQTPLQDAGILHGQPPPENLGSIQGKPLDEKTKGGKR